MAGVERAGGNVVVEMADAGNYSFHFCVSFTFPRATA